jgi:hypothetical protein
MPGSSSKLPYHRRRSIKCRHVRSGSGTGIRGPLLPIRSRSRVEGDKRTERSGIEHGPCHCRKQLDGGDHGSRVEVSGSVVSVPPGESATTGQRIPASISADRPPTCYREIHERPSEGTSDTSPQIASVSSDRRAQASLPPQSALRGERVSEHSISGFVACPGAGQQTSSHVGR